MKKARKELKEYNKTKEMVKRLNIKIQELINKKVPEDKIQKIILFKNRNVRRIKRVENAMSILSEEEKELLQFVCIEHNNYIVAEEKFNIGYARMKQIEGIALDKMEKYII